MALHNTCQEGRWLLNRYLMALAADEEAWSGVDFRPATAKNANTLREALVDARNAYWAMSKDTGVVRERRNSSSGALNHMAR